MKALTYFLLCSHLCCKHILYCVSHIYEYQIYTYFFAYIHIHAICIVPTAFFQLNTQTFAYILTHQKYILYTSVLSFILWSCLLNIFWRICASCHSPLIRFLTCKNMRHVVENFILFYFFSFVLVFKWIPVALFFLLLRT